MVPVGCSTFMATNAVRIWSHKPIYHSALKIHHFSPVIALLLEKNKDIQETVDEITLPVVKIAEDIRKDVKKIVK